MRTIYFDCFSGVSGSMILGAFLDAGLDFAYLKKQLHKLKLSGYELKKRKVRKGGLPATEFEVILFNNKKIDPRKKTLKDIKNIINRSSLSQTVKNFSCRVFDNLAEAESRAHGYKKNKVHFHELGDIDSLIDIVGAAIAFDYLKIDKAYSSALNLGGGLIKTAHGNLPVPAPATGILLKDAAAYSGGTPYELTTPTGAAVLKTACERFGPMPFLEIERIGLGAGSFNIREHPNALRVFFGRSKKDIGVKDYNGYDYDKDTVIVLEANIHDMNLVGTERILERIFQAGALDVCFQPVYMKKSRMGMILSVITESVFLEPVLKAIFEETTTFGVRTYPVTRYKLQRFIKTVKTKYGSLKVKIGKLTDRVNNISPEYEDCRKLSIRKDIPFRDVYKEAEFLAKKTYKNCKLVKNT